MNRYCTHGSFCKRSTAFSFSNNALCNFSYLIVRHQEKILLLHFLYNQKRKTWLPEHCSSQTRNRNPSMGKIAFSSQESGYCTVLCSCQTRWASPQAATLPGCSSSFKCISHFGMWLYHRAELLANVLTGAIYLLVGALFKYHKMERSAWRSSKSRQDGIRKYRRYGKSKYKR